MKRHRCTSIVAAGVLSAGVLLGMVGAAGAAVPAKTTACKALGKAQVEAYTSLTASSDGKEPAFGGETACKWLLNDGEQTVRVWVDQTKGASGKFNENKNATTDEVAVPELGSKAFYSGSGNTVNYLKGKTLVQVQYLASERTPEEQQAGAVARSRRPRCRAPDPARSQRVRRRRGAARRHGRGRCRSPPDRCSARTGKRSVSTYASTSRRTASRSTAGRLLACSISCAAATGWRTTGRARRPACCCQVAITAAPTHLQG